MSDETKRARRLNAQDVSIDSPSIEDLEGTKRAAEGDGMRTGYMQHSGPWKCAYCPFEVPYDPDWGKMSQASIAHVEAEHRQAAQPIEGDGGEPREMVKIVHPTRQEMHTRLLEILNSYLGKCGEPQKQIVREEIMEADFYARCLFGWPTTPSAQSVETPIQLLRMLWNSMRYVDKYNLEGDLEERIEAALSSNPQPTDEVITEYLRRIASSTTGEARDCVEVLTNRILGIGHAIDIPPATPPSTGVTERGFEEWLHKQVEYIALTDVHGDVVARCVTSLIRKTWNAALASREEK